MSAPSFFHWNVNGPEPVGESESVTSWPAVTDWTGGGAGTYPTAAGAASRAKLPAGDPPAVVKLPPAKSDGPPPTSVACRARTVSPTPPATPDHAVPSHR